ncbi:MAG: dicarboxylate/amino acid:cation symporter [Candidatus Marinimicrobia bacterium]|nr:dicarboxylate/amino acid:cation symporter [Candidatus Neomarinimicrobiota bacterium]|tara:strand:- start:5033 stop:6277 length:1245 start_codon:yes stop_codon:yes gene_type:complete
MTKLKLHWQIFISMIIGVGIGIYFQNFGIDNLIYSIITSFGTIFVRLLKMIIVPLIFTSIIIGVASIKDSSRLGRLGIKTILYYTMTSLFAIIIGLTLTNLVQPGVGINLGENEGFDASKLATPGSPAEILIRMIPLNPFNAASNGDMLGIIFFAIFLGISISRLKGKHQSTLSNFFEAMFQAIMKMTQSIIMLAPIGVLGLITKAVSNSGFEIFTAVGKYMATIALGLSIHIFIILPIFFLIMTRINPIKHYKGMASAMATAFSTSSSSATLPVTMRCVKENAGISNETTSFVLPMGATVNMDGTALYECAGVIFISQVLGIELSLTQQFTVVITALLASIGAAGIPSAGLVMIFIVTQAVGFKDEDVALIVGTMLAVDRPLDMFRTMVNITSDSIGAAVIAKSEGENLYPNG